MFVCLLSWPLLLAALFAPSAAMAAVLADDRADALYHYYDGGGVEVQGPAVLVRKGDNANVSGFAHYYIDNVTSASVDVLSYASPYTEQRNEFGLGIDYLNEDTTLTFAYSNSEESDYSANTFNLAFSQEMLSGMTTLNMSVSRGFNEVRDNTNPTFEETADVWKWRMGVGQVFTKKFVMNFDFEVIHSQGFLNNPYRKVRIDGNFVAPEVYPDKRNSLALAARGMYYLGKRSSTRFEARYFNDDWEVNALNLEGGYTHYYTPKLLAEYRGRFYTQNKAFHYSDNFDSVQRFMARDKELSTFSSVSVGYKLTYEIWKRSDRLLKQGDISFAYNLFYFDYEDFTDPTNNNEPYSFHANVAQILFSLRY
ncbi:MAG: DUF3570 domain-containing protein [Pseudomonadota bacterium]|nr:MAG: DUF3570 domain-containing protein [Pseudomonadota bacterium]